MVHAALDVGFEFYHALRRLRDFLGDKFLETEDDDDEVQEIPDYDKVAVTYFTTISIYHL